MHTCELWVWVEVTVSRVNALHHIRTRNKGRRRRPFFFIDVVGCSTCDITAINGRREPTRGHKYYVVRVQNCEISERDWHCIRQKSQVSQSPICWWWSIWPSAIYFVRHTTAFRTIYDKIYHSQLWARLLRPNIGKWTFGVPVVPLNENGRMWTNAKWNAKHIRNLDRDRVCTAFGHLADWMRSACGKSIQEVQALSVCIRSYNQVSVVRSKEEKET